MSGEGLLEEIGENPLPASFELRLNAESRRLEAIEKIASEVGSWEEVDEVSYGGSWIGQLDTLSRRLVWLNLFVGLAVALGMGRSGPTTSTA